MKSESEKREWKVRAKSGSEKWEWKVRVKSESETCWTPSRQFPSAPWPSSPCGGCHPSRRELQCSHVCKCKWGLTSDFKLRSSTVKVNCHRVPPFWDVIEAKRRTTLKIRYLSIYQTRTIHFVSQSSLGESSCLESSVIIDQYGRVLRCRQTNSKATRNCCFKFPIKYNKTKSRFGLKQLAWDNKKNDSLLEALGRCPLAHRRPPPHSPFPSLLSPLQTNVLSPLTNFGQIDWRQTRYIL